MPTIDSAYQSLYGCGYLILDDDHGPTTMTDYKLVVDMDDFTGGGFLSGLNDEDSFKAAQLGTVRLSLGTVGQCLSLAVGRYEGNADLLPVIALGRTTGPNLLAPFETE
jgi:hypothetical protein